MSTFLKLDANPLDVDNDENTLLHILAANYYEGNEDYKYSFYLLKQQNGFNLEATNNKGLTPFAVAVLKGNFDSAKFLYDQGAIIPDDLFENISFRDLSTDSGKLFYYERIRFIEGLEKKERQLNLEKDQLMNDDLKEIENYVDSKMKDGKDELQHEIEKLKNNLLSIEQEEMKERPEKEDELKLNKFLDATLEDGNIYLKDYLSDKDDRN